MWEELIGIVGLLNLSVIHLIKPTLQLRVSTLPSSDLDHMDPVIAAWEPHRHHCLAQADAGKSCKVLGWVCSAGGGENDGYLPCRALSVLSDAGLSFPSDLSYTMPWRCCSNFSIFKTLQHRWLHVGSSLNPQMLETPPSLSSVSWEDSFTATARDSSKHCSSRITLHFSFAVC